MTWYVSVNKGASYGIFFFFLVGSTLLSLTGSSWFVVWMGMELNVLAFLPLMVYFGSFMEVEGAVQYFLVQAFGGLIMLFGILVGFVEVVCLGLLVKLGVFPFYQWVPSVCYKVNWGVVMLLLTWQKLAALGGLFVVQDCFGFYYIICISVAGSSVLGGVMGMIQSDLRGLMAYSSLVHMGWMMSCNFISFGCAFIYFLVYCSGSLFVMGMFFCLKNYSLVGMFFGAEGEYCFAALLGFMSMWGFPPSIGFFGKFLVLWGLMSESLWFLSFFILFGSCVSLYYYSSFVISKGVIASHWMDVAKSFVEHYWVGLGLFLLLSGGGVLGFLWFL